VLAVREETFIEASRSVGAGPLRMIRRHILPNVASPLIVQTALSFGYALLAEAGLSFLGLGVQPPNASWGVMLQEAYQFVLSDPWATVVPGVAIALTVLSFNFVGDGLRDALGRERVKAGR
jgi:ABC-type dipeptide/oligopeptide/nickel transport system permease subunit